MDGRTITSLVALIATVGIATTAVPQVPPLADTQADWRVGFSSFRDDGLAEGDRYLLDSIPLLLIEQLGGVRGHQLSEAERASRGAAVLLGVRRTQSERVAGLQRALGEAQLRGVSRSTVEREHAEAVERLRTLRELAADTVAVADSKPVVIVAASSESPLYPAVSFSIARFAAHSGLDLLVTGTVAEVEGFLFVEAAAFDTAATSQVFAFSVAAPREGVSAIAERIGRELATVLLGSPWATVTIEPDPTLATVAIDGTFVGTGRTVVPFLPAGQHVVELAAAAHAPQRIELTVSGGEQLTLTPSLTAAPPVTVAVTSLPPGAAAYVDSVWVGSTPLAVAVADGGSRLELRRDGYFPRALDLPPRPPSVVRITLDPAIDDRQTQQEMSRDRFYRALGWFVAATAPPLLLGMAVADATSRVNSLGASAADSAGAREQRTWLLRGVFTSVIATGMTFGVSMEALGDYLLAANRSAS